jgi:hypothetical protein
MEGGRAQRDPRRRRRAEEGKGGKGKEGETDQWVPAVSGSKKKKREGGNGLTREAGWAAWAKRAGALAFVFFLLFFQTPFSNHFSTLNQIKLFQTFLKNFIDFLETTQATKNHASQMMMHIHLLSLNLLNYL